MNRITETNCNPFLTAEVFHLPGKATQNTHWIKEPADPTRLNGGPIQKGEIVWFEQDLFGTGPDWQQALLHNQDLVYVNPRHFIRVTSRSKT